MTLTMEVTHHSMIHLREHLGNCPDTKRKYSEVVITFYGTHNRDNSKHKKVRCRAEQLTISDLSQDTNLPDKIPGVWWHLHNRILFKNQGYYVRACIELDPHPGGDSERGGMA